MPLPRVALPLTIRCEFSVLPRIGRSIATASALLALLAACSGPAPSPEATLVPSVAPTTESVPAAAPLNPPGLLLNEPESFEGYTLFTWDNAYLVDNLGRTVHRWELAPSSELVKLLDNGNLLTTGNREIDPDGNAVWDYRHPQHHDILKLPNGNVLILSREFISREEAVALGANPDALTCRFLRAPRIVEVRPTGPTDAEVVWEWSMLDHLIQDFDPEKPNYGAVAEHPELADINFMLAEARCVAGRAIWLHANALDYNADLDQIMLIARKFSEIWIIDHSTSTEEAAGHTGGNGGRGGDLLYRWGNPRAHRAGTLVDQRLFWPHNAHWIPEGLPGAGNVLIFNNGNEHSGLERGYSSVDEIALPADGYTYRLDEGLTHGPDELVWRYAADPPHSFYASLGSGAQRLPNGNTLVTDSMAMRIFEATAEGKTVWDFSAALTSDGHKVYRSYRYAPNHPGIQALLAPYRAAYADVAGREPAARSVFNAHATDKNLVYVKERCDQDDVESRFFLHITPERTDDLPTERRRHGFDNRNFDFLLRGALFDGKCAARVPLPGYPIASIRTGQFTPDGELWSAEFAIGGGAP